jgi:hypothetical protein
MLVTRLDHELKGLPFLWAPGTQAWRAVTFELAIPYILVGVRHHEGNAWHLETSILWRDEDVLELCRDSRSTKDRKLVRIALLLPPRARSKANWRIRVVTEVWSRPSSDPSRRSISYFGANGLRLGATTLGEDGELKGTLEYPV